MAKIVKAENQVVLISLLHYIVIDITPFIAAIKMILEGKVRVAFARNTVTSTLSPTYREAPPIQIPATRMIHPPQRRI